MRLGASPRPRPFVRVLSIRLSDHATRRYVLERVPDLPMRYEVNVNGRRQTIDVSPDTPLLWVLRETLGLTGTKFGCGVAQCGAHRPAQRQADSRLRDAGGELATDRCECAGAPVSRGTGQQSSLCKWQSTTSDEHGLNPASSSASTKHSSP